MDSITLETIPRVDIIIKQGSTFNLVMMQEGGDGNFFDFDGWSARCQIRPDYDSSTILLDATTANDKLIVTDDGHIAFALTPTVTAAFSWSQPAFYDVEVVSPDGEYVMTLQYGQATLQREITR